MSAFCQIFLATQRNFALDFREQARETLVRGQKLLQDTAVRKSIDRDKRLEFIDGNSAPVGDRGLNKERDAFPDFREDCFDRLG